MNALFGMLSAIEPQHWFVLALLLLIAELASGTTHLLWAAVAAGVTGLFAWLVPGSPWMLDMALFAMLLIALTLFARPLVRNRLLRKSDDPGLNERAASLIGAQGAAADAFVNGFGSVRIADTVWRARSEEPIEPGALVQVLGVDGVTLTVKRAV